MSETPLLACCPICGSKERQILFIRRFLTIDKGHVWCRICDATYDSDTAEIQTLFAAGKADPKQVKSDAEYRRLFVETSDITGARGAVYPKFEWDDNAEMQARISAGIAASLQRFLAVESPRILDLGCGNGFTTRGLARVFGTSAMVGVDPSPKVLELKAEPAIECHQGTLQQAGFLPESFDAVSIIGNLMLHPDPSDTLAEVWRVLRPGGIVVFDVKNIRSATRMVARRIATISPRLARNSLVQRNFVNMRFGLHRQHVAWLCPPDRFELLAIETGPPRLLAHGNRSHYASGVKGLIWRLAALIDRWRDEESWLQVTVRKRG